MARARQLVGISSIKPIKKALSGYGLGNASPMVKSAGDLRELPSKKKDKSLASQSPNPFPDMGR